MVPLRAFALATGLVLSLMQAAGATETIRVGVLKYGTVAWEMDVIRAHGLDAANDVAVEVVELASNDAARIAFQGGEVDTIVSDVLWAARMRADGRPVVYVPFSTAEGSLMVAAGSPVKTLADLKGKKVGVTGGPLDKGWLLLQAAAKRSAGLDLVHDAEPVFGAPPLIQQKLEAGELDAALLFWNFAARTEVKGFREVTTIATIARGLGSRGDVSMIGYIFSDKTTTGRPQAIKGFVAASRAAKALLATSDAEWDRIRPLTKAEDDATFAALKRRFRAGIPMRPWTEEEADVSVVYAILADIGGDKLVGRATSLPAGIYWPGVGN